MRKSSISTLYHRWYSWTRTSILHKVFGAALIVGMLSSASAIVSMVKAMVVAAFFGLGDALDAFFIAFLPISFVIVVVVEAFTSALIPTYIRVRDQQGVSVAQDLFVQSMIVVVASLSIVAALLALSSPYLLPFLCGGFDAEKLALTQRLFYFLLPTVVIKGLAAVWSGILNAGERFGLPALSPIVVSVSLIIALFVWGSDYGVYALVVGTIGGFLLELPLLGWGLKRYGIALLPCRHGINPALRQVVAQYFPLVAAAALMGGTTFVDAAMAAALSPGSVTALNYGNKVVAMIAGLGALALGTAVFPFFSQLIGVEDWTTIRHLLKKYSLLILLVAIPVTLLLIIVSESLVSLLFQRGEFREMDTQLVGQIQAMYGLQIPFYVLGILFVRLISAGRANHILMVGSFLNLLLNVVLNYIFMQYWGVVGIALSTACVYIFSSGFLFIMSHRYLLRS